MTFEQLKAQESQYVMNTYGRFPIALDHGEKSVLWDVEDKRYVDMTSGIGVCSVGYNNEKIISAITEQAQKLMHVSNLFTTEPMENCKNSCRVHWYGQGVFLQLWCRI